MGVTIDFELMAPRLRPRTKLARIAHEQKASFKLSTRLVLSAIDLKTRVLEESILSMDRSRFNVSALELQVSELKSLLVVANAALDAL
jgi:hypothetical protein